MKQFFAILGDSYREAKDAKIIYVMFVFSFLLILGILSVSLRPVGMVEVVSNPVESLNDVFGIQRTFAQPGMALPPVFAIENFTQPHDAANPWDGPFSFDFVLRYDKLSDKDSKAGGLPPIDAMFIERLYREPDFYFLKGVKAKEVPDDPLVMRYSVTVPETTITDRKEWIHEPRIGFGLYGLPTKRSVQQCVYYVEKWMVHEIGAWFAVLIGIIVTSFFIPNMIRKGTLDLFISKPIHRVVLLIYKYIGGLTFMFIVTSVTVGGVWLALGVRTGIWATNFLWVIPVVMFYFAILYSISTCVGYLTRSPILAILATFLMWGIFWANGFAHSKLEQARDVVELLEHEAEHPGSMMAARRAARAVTDDDKKIKVKPRWREARVLGISPVWTRSSDVLYTVLPRTSDLDSFTSNFIGRDVLNAGERANHEMQKSAALFDWYEVNLFGTKIEYPMWLETVFFSFGFIALMLGISIWRFVKMDA